DDSQIAPSIKADAHLARIEYSASPAAALQLLREAKAFFGQHNLDQAELLLMELTQQVRGGDVQGFQQTVRTLTTEYRHREDIMAALQQMLVSMGLINPDGSPRELPRRQAAAPEAAPRDSGIWTPGGS